MRIRAKKQKLRCAKRARTSPTQSSGKFAGNLRAAPVVGSGGDAHAAKFVGVVFAVEHVPFFAAFENFFFLRSDFLAHFDVRLFFFAQRISEDRHDLLADGVAVFNEVHFLARNQYFGDLMGESNNFLAAKSHSSRLSSKLFQRRAQFARVLTLKIFAFLSSLPLFFS